jgi:hypothetical protein
LANQLSLFLLPEADFYHLGCLWCAYDLDL